MSEAERGTAGRPVAKVGDPTDEEIAAAVLALVTLSRDEDEEPEPSARAPWAAYERGLRPALRPGPDAWRRSRLP